MISNNSREILNDSNKPIEFLIGLIFVFSIYLISVGLDIFQKTFISLKNLFPIICIGAIVTFFIFWFLTKKFLNIYKILVVAPIIGGGVFYFISLYLNKELGRNEISSENFIIQSAGTLPQGASGECERPFAIIDFHGYDKELILDCEYNTKIYRYKQVQLEYYIGYFGYPVIQNTKLID